MGSLFASSLMQTQFKTVSSIAGPLLFVTLPDNVQVGYDELAEVSVPGEKKKSTDGKSARSFKGRVMLQMFEATDGIPVTETKVRF